jgi:predicted nucleic acid-binding protein
MIFLDTNICIGILHANPIVLSHIRAASEPLAIPGMVEGELYYGVEKSSDPKTNLARTENLLRSLPIYHPTSGIMRLFGRLKAELERKGTRVDDADVLIAATAIEFDATLATGNIRHFKRFIVAHIIL